ncbi:hypothetical protein DYI25_03440 [Mesobacillus boroniphilus]|uniref:Uncharacterized protein n=1 Tax=Mesobacillus boroniphilus TaxID=308892 RepID=A0A944CKL5_9BACI|nr:hypothetical protein [Mesobacillus boroniphilus]MBS8263493.1 hypothetical protein [Mesobacillus boroniphilus]
MSCGISWTGETPQELAPRRLNASPEEEFALRKPAVGLFHNSSRGKPSAWNGNQQPRLTQL